MQLISIPDFIATKITGNKKPNERSVKRWIKDGKFPYISLRMGNDTFIDLDTPNNTGHNVKNILLKRILEHGSQTP